MLELRQVSKKLGSYQAVDGLSLGAETGRFVTLLGPSGCGKTTTLRLIAGFYSPDEGEILFEGKLLSSPKYCIPPEKRRMGMVFQTYAVWPHMKVFDNVAYGLKLRHEPKQEIRERVLSTLKMVGLGGLEERYPSQLSGGQQQRVALARAIVTEPEVLLLDEPLSNLDAKLRDRMRFELKDLQNRLKITFIYVTHDQVEALIVSDLIAVINSGRVQQVGTTSEIYETPANSFVADFIGATNMIPIKGASTAAEGVVVVTTEDGDLLRSPSRSPPEGSYKFMCIRPEAVDIYKKKPSVDGDVYEAKIERAVIAGNVKYCIVRIGELSLRVFTKPGETFSSGESAYVRINECILLRE